MRPIVVSAPSDAGRGSLAVVDGLKAAACCLIVLHHLAFYGPMADHAAAWFPALFYWLADEARMAVQVFLVVGGFLAMRGLLNEVARDAVVGWRLALKLVLRRFVRLAVPLWAALLLAIGANALADHWMDHHSISEWPQALQFLAHLLLLQDIVGHEALSAGIWYVAVDFQLYTALCVLVVAAHAVPRAEGAAGLPVAMVAVGNLALMAASALIFNRDAAWDVAAPYYWTSYGLGVSVALATTSAMPGGHGSVARNRQMALAGWAVLAVALVVEFRWRLAVAGATALALAWGLGAAQRGWASVGPAIRGLSAISYSVFLVHFPVSLVVNAAWTEFLPARADVQLLGVVTAFKLSLLCGWLFHRWVEQPLPRLVHRRLSAPGA